MGYCYGLPGLRSEWGQMSGQNDRWDIGYQTSSLQDAGHSKFNILKSLV